MRAQKELGADRRDTQLRIPLLEAKPPKETLPLCAGAGFSHPFGSSDTFVTSLIPTPEPWEEPDKRDRLVPAAPGTCSEALGVLGITLMARGHR